MANKEDAPGQVLTADEAWFHEWRTANGLPDTGVAYRVLRNRRRYKQADVAAHVGVSKQAVSYWERGVATPSDEHRLKMLELLRPASSRLAKTGRACPACGNPTLAQQTIDGSTPSGAVDWCPVCQRWVAAAA